MLARADYEAALATRARRVGRYCGAYIRDNSGGAARIGVIVGRKAAPRAVDRNRIKRLAREMFRQQRHRLGNRDLVIQVRRCPEPTAWGALRREIYGLMDEMARWQEGQSG